jgi:putative membrane protein
MKRPLVLLMLAALTACGGDKEDETGETPVTAADSARVAAAREPIFSEAEAIGVLKAIGDAEIAMARTAAQISQNDAVLAFSRVVIADHQGIAGLLTAPAQDNTMSAAVRAAGDSIARAFMAMQGGFNNTYIEEQVKSHKQALEMMDTAIIPSVRDTAVKNLLTQIRPTIAAHHQRALQILATRRKEAADRGEAWVSGFQRPAATTGAAATTPVGAQPAPQPQQRPEQPQPVPADTSAPPATTTNQ